MASCEPSSQSKSPQPSCSGHFPEATVDEEIPGPPEPSPQLQSGGQKRVWSDAFEEDLAPGSKDTWVVESFSGLKMKLKRQRVSSVLREHEEDPAPESKVTWVVESFCGLKMNLKRQRVTSVLPEHHEVFNRLLEDPTVKRFLDWDKGLIVSDKYLLSMVIAYFGRAGLFSWDFRPIVFFVALYLASDMEEDNHLPKEAILRFLYGKNSASRVSFQKLRFQFFLCMDWRARVTREECEEIQAYDPEHWVWGRDRAVLP